MMSRLGAAIHRKEMLFVNVRMCSLVFIMFLTALLAHSAFATTAEVELKSGVNNVTITDNGGGDLDPTVGSIIYSNSTFNGWNIHFVAGTSTSPDIFPTAL